MKIKGRQLILGDPGSADILIFDEVNSQYVKKAINEKHSVSVFKTRPENIFIGPKTLINFFRCIRAIKNKEIRTSERGWLLGLLRQFKLAYFTACFLTIRPKAIVTQIDNSADFHWLSKNCRLFPFIAIQNGSRLSFMSESTKGFYLQHFFCFGGHEMQLFPKIGYNVENFYPVGSLIASLHFDEPEEVNINYDILILSAWRGNIGFAKDVEDTMCSMRIMDELLTKYLRQRNYKAAIILRSVRDGEHWYMPELGMNEEDYYKGIYGDAAAIIETDFTKRNIYPLVQQSRFIISFLTSVLFEGFGIGKKALLCNFTGVDTYHLDFDQAIVTTCSKFDEFSIKIDELLDMPQEEYDSRYRELEQYYMSFPTNKTTEQVIADQIDKIIS